MLHIHDYRLYKYMNYSDTSYSESGMPSHILTHRCEKCFKTKYTINYSGGLITPSEFELMKLNESTRLSKDNSLWMKIKDIWKSIRLR